MMKSTVVALFLIVGLLICCGSTRPVPPKMPIEVKCPYPQETHIQYTIAYLNEANVKERITWDVTEPDSSRISVDRYDGAGHKIEAIEYYEGKRKLKKFINSDWREINTTTRFTFKYDEKGRQVERHNHNYDPKQWNQMYQYDQYGNIEHWEDGRSFQLSSKFICTYDSLNSIVYEYNCWEENSCSPPDTFLRSYYIHHIKYDQEGLITEDLRNYMDAMSGWTYEYEKNNSKQVIGITKTSVWSYFGLDHQVPTIKDIDRTMAYNTWKFEYDVNGKLKKEIRTDKWLGYDQVHEFIYNEKGLIMTETTDHEMIVYVYNDKGLVIEESHYYNPNSDKKLYKKLHFQYVYE